MTVPLFRSIFWAFALLAWRAGSASGAFTYTTIDHPLAGVGGTVPNDIEGGQIVGSYLDASGVTHGFLFDGATWSTLDHPAAAAPGGTAAYGISDGVVCGSYVDASGQTLGFLYDGVNWTTLDRPPLGIGPVDTFARGISDGTVVGYSIENVAARGFVYRDGVFTDLVIPGAVGTFPQDVDPGRIVGTYDDLVETHGFLYDGAVVTTLDHPLGLPLGTFVTGIDGPNVVGNYLSLQDGMGHGFLYDGKQYIPIDVPGATDTSVNGISGSRVVGTYADADGQRHGFVASVPEPVVAGTALACLALMARPCRRRRRERGA
jgi:hypothetical protein